jgi:hypothetical protein
MFNKTALKLISPKFGKYMAAALNADRGLVRDVNAAKMKDEAIIVQWEGANQKFLIDRPGASFESSWLTPLRTRDDVNTGLFMSAYWLPDLLREPTGEYCVYELNILDPENNKITVNLNSPKDTSAFGGFIENDTGKSYIGVTKRGIDTRIKEHLRSTLGPKYLFHRFLSKASLGRIFVRALRVGVDFDTAMNTEEKLVAAATLYPLGLNSIPGGFAGIKYLASKGFKANAQEINGSRDKIVTRFLEGRKDNPLFALRLQTDDELITRMICGNPNNFSEAEVRKIRAMDEIGWGHEAIATNLGASVRRVSNLLEGKTYSRVA